MKHVRVLRSICLFLAAILIVGAAAACSNSGNRTQPDTAPASTPSSQTTEPSAETTEPEPEPEIVIEEPYTLTMMVDNFRPDVPPADSPQKQFIEENTGTLLDLNWVPNASYQDILNARIAANDMPKVMVVTTLRNVGVLNAIRSGVFWELEPYINPEEFPNLSKMHPVQVDNVRVDGNMYGIPRHSNLVNHGVSYRYDWAMSLGLGEPSTMGDLYELAKAFTHEDPDGNGQDDTLGMIMHSGMELFTFLLPLFGGPNVWDVVDGKFIPEHETPEYMELLLWFKRLYDEGLMNRDFAVTNNVQRDEKWETGTVGISVDGLVNASKAVAANPDTDYRNARIISPKGERYYSTSGSNGIYLIPKSSVPTETELKRVLLFFERLSSPEMQTFMQWGLEGVHYEMENGFAKFIDRTRFIEEVDILRRIKPPNMSELLPGVPSPQDNFQSSQRMEPYALGNPALSLSSVTFEERNAELRNIINDARVKFVMGEIDEAGWQQALSQWRQAGGDQMIREYEEAYKSANS